MTADDFGHWLRTMRAKRIYPTDHEARLALGKSGDAIWRYKNNGADLVIALACAALAAGLTPWRAPPSDEDYGPAAAEKRDHGLSINYWSEAGSWWWTYEGAGRWGPYKKIDYVKIAARRHFPNRGKDWFTFIEGKPGSKADKAARQEVASESA